MKVSAVPVLPYPFIHYDYDIKTLFTLPHSVKTLCGDALVTAFLRGFAR